MDLSVTGYEPPIKAIFEQVNEQFEGEVLKAVQSVGFDVDAEELAKALQYDRNQYFRGFRDGAQAYEDTIVFCKDCVECFTVREEELWCGGHEVYPNGYCAWGRRKEDEECLS